MRIALTIAAVLGTGCSAVVAAMHPMHVETEREVPGLGLARDPASYTIRGVSSEASQLSGRNNLVVTATLGTATADRVEILALLASTEAGNVDPNNFYVQLDVDGRTTDVETVELGQVADMPYDYTVSYPVQVQSGMIALPDGSVARIYDSQIQHENRRESYYVRQAKLVFRRTGVTPTTRAIRLDLADLGVDVELTWHVHAGGAS